MAEIQAGNSTEQQAAEPVMLELLGRQLGIKLNKDRYYFTPASWLEVDGYCAAPPVLVEAWAHQGPPKVAQKYKVMNDVAKMAWLAATHFPGARKILLFSDPAAAAHFRGKSWMAAALIHLGVEVMVVELPPNHLAAIRAAQVRQYR